MCVMRTALATLLTFCPPGPLERTNATMSRSLSGNFDVAFVFLVIGDDVDRREARLPLVLGVERARTHEPVYADLGPHVAVRVFTLHEQRDRLDARLFTPLPVGFGDVPASSFEEVEVHAQQHLGPVLGLGAAGAGVDLDEAVLRVVLAVKQGLQLDPLAASFEVGQRAVGLVDGRGVVGLLAELVHRADVLDVAQHRVDRVHHDLQRLQLGDDRLGLFLVVPEVGLAHLRFELFSAGTFCGKSKRVPDRDDPGGKDLRSPVAGSRESSD
jgi:hypothetical protein